jgi:hypothetical protein
MIAIALTFYAVLAMILAGVVTVFNRRWQR